MKYAIPALMVVAALGCNPKLRGIYINEPTQLNSDEVKIAETQFKKNDGQELCERALYFGLGGNQLNSILMTEHCVDPMLNQGIYSSVRYTRETDDNLFDQVCETEGNSYIGRNFEAVSNCLEIEPTTSDYLIMKGLRFVYETNLE